VPETAHATFAHDRAAVVTVGVLQIINTALLRWFDGDDADMPAARAAVENLLRDEFFDIARQVRDEIAPD
jgi:hypothetical protein